MKLSKSDQAYILRWAKRVKAINALGGECNICKTKDIFVLDFHHCGAKEIEISRHLNHGGRWSTLNKEIKQCVLLCRNCHAEHHHKDGRASKKKTETLINLEKIECEECGYKGRNYASLDFHHLDGIKIFHLSDVFSRKKSVNVVLLKEEIEKCSVLCRNCHTKKHININKYKIYEQEILKRSEKQCEIRGNVSKIDVIKMLLGGMKQIEISRKIGCAKSTISRIVNNHIDSQLME